MSANGIFEEWTELIGNQGMMIAILDRLLHRVEIIHVTKVSKFDFIRFF